MKKLTLLIAMVVIFTTSQAQVDFTIDPVYPSHMSISVVGCIDSSNVFAGAVFDHDINTGFTSAAFSARIDLTPVALEYNDIYFFAGAFIGIAGIDDIGIAGGIYLTEQFYFRNFPLGLSVYQRVFGCQETGFFYENRVGLVFNIREKKSK